MNRIFLISVIILLLGAGVYFINNSSDTQNQESSQSQISPIEENAADHSNHASIVTDDKSFILAMIPHHEEAITTSQEILKVSETQEVRSLAEDIIQAQEKEVTEMKTWYFEWFEEEYKDNGQYKAMMPSLAGKTPQEAEQAYLQGMIGHHEGAVVMAEQILKITKQEELKQLGNTIIFTQNQEIEMIKGLLKGDTTEHESHH